MKTRNTAKEIADFMGDSKSAVDCFNSRAKKKDKYAITPKRLLVYRILANCDLNSLKPYNDNSNFKDEGIYAASKLSNIKALNPREDKEKG